MNKKMISLIVILLIIGTTGFASAAELKNKPDEQQDEDQEGEVINVNMAVIRLSDDGEFIGEFPGLVWFLFPKFPLENNIYRVILTPLVIRITSGTLTVMGPCDPITLHPNDTLVAKCYVGDLDANYETNTCLDGIAGFITITLN